MENKHAKFWLTVGSGVTAISIFIFMIYTSVVTQFTFKKEYCLFLIPILIYAVAQFAINYCKMTE